MATSPKPRPELRAIPLVGATQRPAERLVAASKAKSQLLELLDIVHRKQEPVTITKRGRPVARLVPIEPRRPSDIFGCMKGTFRIAGDIVGPEPEEWEAMR